MRGFPPLRNLLRRERAVSPCVGLWGGACILEGHPTLHAFENALYVPWSHGGPWGLFKEDRTVIAEAVDVRLPERLVSGPEPEFPGEDLGEVDEVNFALYLGFINVHYGHFIINSLPRFWPLLDRRALGDPLLLCHTRGTRADWERYPFIGAMLGGLGLTLDELKAPLRATRIRRLLVAEASLCEQSHAYPIFGALGEAVGRGCWNDADKDGESRPLYLSKTKLASGIGRLAQESMIEDMLAGAGIDVAHPETMTFPEQVATMARRRTILATTGSSLHTSIFSAPNRRIIGVSLSELVNSNYALIDALNGNTSQYVYPSFTGRIEGDDFHITHHLRDPRGVAKALIRLC